MSGGRGVGEVWGQEMSLTEGCAKSGVFNSKLINEGSAFLPPTIGFICGCKGGL